MEQSVFLSKELLLSVKDELAIERVELLNGKGEVRGHVFVREMTAKEKSLWEKSLTKRVPPIGQGKNRQPEEIVLNLDDSRAKLAICTLCNEDGVLLFNDMLPNTIKALSESLSASNMERIADAANRLNKITPEAQEEVTKNSEAVAEDSSYSDSASN